MTFKMVHFFALVGKPQVQKSANFMPEGAIFKKECKKSHFLVLS